MTHAEFKISNVEGMSRFAPALFNRYFSINASAQRFHPSKF